MGKGEGKPIKTEFLGATKELFPDILDMMAAFYAIDGYPFNKKRTEKNLSHFVANPDLGRARAIRINGVIAGYLILTFGFSFEHNGREAFLDELFLKPEYRQKGIGKIVMDFIEKEALELGVNVVHLEVEQHNEAGITLYKEKGYEDNNRILLSKKILKDSEL